MIAEILLRCLTRGPLDLGFEKITKKSYLEMLHSIYPSRTLNLIKYNEDQLDRAMFQEKVWLSQRAFKCLVNHRDKNIKFGGTNEVIAICFLFLFQQIHKYRLKRVTSISITRSKLYLNE